MSMLGRGIYAAILVGGLIACRDDRVDMPMAAADLAATPVSAVGQSLLLLKGGETQAAIDMPAGAQYMIAVVNTANTYLYSEDFALRGKGSTGEPATVSTTMPTLNVVPTSAVTRWAGATDPHLT